MWSVIVLKMAHKSTQHALTRRELTDRTRHLVFYLRSSEENFSPQ